MNQNQIKSLFKLYPQITTIRGDKAFDVNDNLVSYDAVAVQAEVASTLYIAQRAAEYPPITDYLDGVVKGDQTQIDAYIAACLAVKAKYPKSE